MEIILGIVSLSTYKIVHCNVSYTSYEPYRKDKKDFGTHITFCRHLIIIVSVKVNAVYFEV